MSLGILIVFNKVGLELVLTRVLPKSSTIYLFNNSVALGLFAGLICRHLEMSSDSSLLYLEEIGGYLPSLIF